MGLRAKTVPLQSLVAVGNNFFESRYFKKLYNPPAPLRVGRGTQFLE